VFFTQIFNHQLDLFFVGFSFIRNSSEVKLLLGSLKATILKRDEVGAPVVVYSLF
jgi:hypothetical protein